MYSVNNGNPRLEGALRIFQVSKIDSFPTENIDEIDIDHLSNSVLTNMKKL